MFVVKNEAAFETGPSEANRVRPQYDIGYVTMLKVNEMLK